MEKALRGEILEINLLVITFNAMGAFDSLYKDTFYQFVPILYFSNTLSNRNIELHAL